MSSAGAGNCQGKSAGGTCTSARAKEPGRCSWWRRVEVAVLGPGRDTATRGREGWKGSLTAARAPASVLLPAGMALSWCGGTAMEPTGMAMGKVASWPLACYGGLAREAGEGSVVSSPACFNRVRSGALVLRTGSLVGGYMGTMSLGGTWHGSSLLPSCVLSPRVASMHKLDQEGTSQPRTRHASCPFPPSHGRGVLKEGLHPCGERRCAACLHSEDFADLASSREDGSPSK